MAERLPVVAAIPNYNMADSLAELLPQVLAQGYDGVYVLDDASTDHSREAATPFGHDIHFIASRENVGPGANRNRMLAALSKEAIIHFIDADVQLISGNNPQIIRQAFEEHPEAGVIGGLTQLPDGKPWIFNYGPRYSVYSRIAGWAQMVANDPAGNPLIRSVADKLSGWRHHGFPDVSKTPTAGQVFWVGEANFSIPLQVFSEVGGFDPVLRFHETQDLSYKLHSAGYETWFMPDIVVEHPEIQSNDPKYKALHRKANKQIIHKHGLPLK